MTETRLRLRAAALAGFLFLASCAGAPGAGRSASDAEMLTGTWAGELVLEEQTLNIVVRFTFSETFEGSIDIPQQAARGLPLVNIRLNTASVYFELPAGAGSALFCGELEEDLIMGTFTQSGQRGSFVLARQPAPR